MGPRTRTATDNQRTIQ